MLKKYIRVFFLASCLVWMSNAEATDVRIALVQGQKTLALQAKDKFFVKDLSSGEKQELPKGKYFAHIKEGKLFLENHRLGREVELIAKEKELMVLNGRTYDGTLVLRVEENNLLATNTIELESFLRRVLPQRTMPVWPDEAIKAQAVAARSYVLYQKQQHSGARFDLAALDKETPYLGVDARQEKAAISKLVQATQGEYLADNLGRPIMAVSTSSSGGKTESGLNAFGKAYSYLQSVEDFDKDSPDYKWDFRISPSYVTAMLEQHGYSLGRLAHIRLSKLSQPGGDRTSTGRVRYLIFGGTLGTAKITGAKLAELLNINSNYFDIEIGTPAPEKLEISIENAYGMEIGRKEIPIKVKEKEPRIGSEYMQSYHIITGGKDEKIIFHGQGKGTGVGLSAWGARELASGEEPLNYLKILKHYYPGTHLVK